MKHLVLTLALGSLFVVSAQATTYVRVEKDGTKTYSDRPIPGGQPVEVQPAQTYSAPPQSPVNARLPREQRLIQGYDEYKYQSCTLSPRPDASFMNPESVPVSADFAPALRPNDVATLTIDGQALQPNLTQHTMTQVSRGTHTVTVTVKNPNGQVMCTASTSFHVQRPSLNSPARSR
jgi:hypothetical protein